MNLKLRHCVAALAQGAVIAYPTEAVWGLGCDPFNLQALRQLLSMKRRDPAKGLILVAAELSHFDFVLHDLDPALRGRLLDTWPGPYTWLVPHHNRVPALVSGEHDTVALRVSAHPLVRQLCHAFGAPLVSSSANRQGQPAARQAWQVRKIFAGEALLCAPGVTGSRRLPSTICDLKTGRILRG